MQQKTKILFMLPALMAGGAERVLITFANHIASQEHYKTSLISISNQGDLKNLISPQVSFHCLNQKLSILSLPHIYRTLRDIQPDIVITTMAHMNFAALALKPFFPKTKFIVREAITPSFLFEKYKIGGALIKCLYKSLYPKADIILSPTQKVFDEFTNDLKMTSEHFHVLPNPVDLEHIHNKITNAPQEKDAATVQFVACGRLGKQKGFDRLIKHLGKADMPHPWSLKILGEGAEKPYLEQLIKEHNLENKITLAGLIRPPFAHFAAADCFLLPSRFEGLPNVVLESLASGTVVIATKESGGIDEIAKEATNNTVQIVETMEEFIEAAKKITAKPYNIAKPSLLPQHYEKSRVIDTFDTILKQVING